MMVILMMVTDEVLIEKLNRIVFELLIQKGIQVNVKFVIMDLLHLLMNVSSNVEMVESIPQKNEKMVIKLTTMDDHLIVK